MPATLILKDRFELATDRFVELIVWELPAPLRGSAHRFKYRLVLIVDGVCVLRYDNEASKGDHKHVGSHEIPYSFTNLKQLTQDFWTDVSCL
ncbi:hypothetical protein CKO42_06000 [Lamprobacter modestohalophilus]|uniref:Uncharacterized protein n=1 Tax=Lamprobacter modestohalophilus TaxID=1064514 RepID=A0A9X0W6T9_9GAMM|nr:DUF6516 family protein [Lamprobacter modestohalophilus]MBK1618010.1 hypothetical protein [Lamprobacter modestohalophilus]